jgi:hypothetical protein
MFRNQNLSGKQVWYITAPASVPIGAIKRVSLKDVQLGKPSLSVNGNKYGFVPDKVEEKGSTKVMIPYDNGGSYRLGTYSSCPKNFLRLWTNGLQLNGQSIKHYIFSK